MAMNIYAKNKLVALKTAAKKTGMTYEDVKAAYKTPYAELDDTQKKAVNIAHAILRNYRKTMQPAQAEAPAVETAE